MPAPIAGAAAPVPSSRPPLASPAAPAAAPPAAADTTDAAAAAALSSAALPFDVTAESAPDSAATLSAAVIRRAELFMLAQHLHNQDMQARIDRMRSEFDNAQARRSELLREMNALRDMALEQMKHDDEVLKKFISWI